MNAIQWKSVKFNPHWHTLSETPERMVTKLGMGDEIGDSYRCAKMYYDPIIGFVPPACRRCCNAHKVTGLVSYCATACNATQGIAKVSVCPSVERVHCDKTKETCAHILQDVKERVSHFDDNNGWGDVTTPCA